MEKQNYRVQIKTRRQGEPPLDELTIEFKSESYDTREEYALAIADAVLDNITADEDYLSQQEG